MHSFQLPSADNVTLSNRTPSAIVVHNPAPIPKGQWPLWAKAISLLKTDADKGIGDTIQRTIGDTNSVAFKTWYLTTFKRSCGCSARQDKWNNSFPY
jgi:hypothetical protein